MLKPICVIQMLTSYHQFIIIVMPERTTRDLFNTALAQLEEIVAELEVKDDSDNLDELLSKFKFEITNLESGSNLSGFKNPEDLKSRVPPKK
jgi:hypothetical protein